MVIGRRGFLAGLLACPVCAAAAPATVSWDYDGDGAGASRDANPAFGKCGVGGQQSPIDLHDGIRGDLPAVIVKWQAAAFAVINNGHTLQLDSSTGSMVEVGSQRAELLQFHFHTPSEHAIDGKRSVMEAHFVHQRGDGLVVLAALLVPGRHHAGFAEIIAAATPRKGERALQHRLDPRSLLPLDLGSAWRYEGSLTTTPCSEIVEWIVFEQPVEVAQADIRAFQKLFPMNARPLQSVDRRYLLRSAAAS